jgi:hypothetical protein
VPHFGNDHQVAVSSQKRGDVTAVVQEVGQTINRPANQNMGQSAVFGVVVLNMMWGGGLLICLFFVDMRSSIPTNGRGSSSKRMRHIDIRYFFVSDRIASKEIRVESCPFVVFL